MTFTQILPYLTLVWIHFFADFVLQSDWMARNKSSDMDALLLHVGVYTVVLAALTCFWPVPVRNGALFVLANFGLHFFTDLVSSRLTRSLRRQQELLPKEQQNWHWFFVVFGADQALHMTALFTTYWYFSR